MKTAEEIKAGLAYFTGTENYYRHGLVPVVVYTDGVQWLAESTDCYWLLDAIASHIVHNGELAEARRRDERLESMQFWTLDVDGSHGRLTCVADANEAPAVVQEIEYTDFPLETISIWASPTLLDNGKPVWVLYLPSEH